MSCFLCDVPEKEAYRVVYRDPRVFVAMNAEPVMPGHLMVLPLHHAERLEDLRAEEAAAFLASIESSMRAVEDYSDGPSLCVINGWDHRTQPHLHAHVVPSKLGLRGLYATAEQRTERIRASVAELTAVTEKLRACYQVRTAKTA